MGKVKRLRQKFHAASSKAKDKKKSDSQTVEDQEMIVESPTKPVNFSNFLKIIYMLNVTF